MAELVPQHHPEPVDVTPGDPPGCRLQCMDRQQCVTCGEDLCPMHSPELVVRCAEDGFHHAIDDCADMCLACDLEAMSDAASERADAIRKGDWY